MKRVVLLGDWMVDRYWIVRQDGLSAEAPIPRYRVTDMKEFPGGAGNVEANLRALGVDVVGFPGPGTHDRWAGSVYRAGTTTQNVKNRMILDGQQIMRWDENDVSPMIEITEELWAALSHTDAIVVADYGKGALHQEVVNLVAKTEAPVFVDTKGDPSVWNFGDRVNMFPNWKEYATYLDAYNEFDAVVLKRGAKGMCFVKRGIPQPIIPALCAEPVSVVGAGDTVIAAYTAAILNGQTHASALYTASAAAAIVVGKPYTSVATPEEIGEWITKARS